MEEEHVQGILLLKTSDASMFAVQHQQELT